METAYLYSLIEKRRKELGLTQAEVGLRAFGKSETTAIQHLRRGSSPSVQNMSKICEALGLYFHIGLTPETAPVESALIDDTHFAAIPRFGAELAAGNGHSNDDGAPVEHLAFSHKWLQKMGVLASQSCLVTVIGDSMTPVLHSGDLVLIDRRRTTIRDGHIYALVDTDGAARVKRLDLVKNEMLVLRSDNPDHKTEFRQGDEMNRVTILGEVVWSGHQLDQARG